MQSSLEDSPMTLVSLRLTYPPNCKGNMGSEGAEWERGSKNREFLPNKSPYLKNAVRQDHSHNDGLIGSRIRAFDWYQNHRPWMTLNGQNALWYRKDASFAAHCTKLNEDIHTCSDKNVGRWLVSGNIRYMQILAGVPPGGGLKCEWGGLRCHFLAIWVASSSELSHIQLFSHLATRLLNKFCVCCMLIG